MSAIESKVAKYRWRAAELRNLAEDWADMRAQEIILEMAREYEKMADTVGSLRIISSDRAA